jgi:4-methyl-5(b-hydroxyethyl)-thiazole monophosphate biosynthesis
MSKSVLVPLAQGFEEIEAVSIIDVLRRSGLTVTTAALSGSEVVGANNITIKADKTLSDVKNSEFDAVVLPGGMPGTTNLLESSELADVLKRHQQSSKLLAAICAAPWVLGAHGILDNKPSTIYPGMEENLPDSCKKTNARVVKDENLITGQGPAVAIEFALEIVNELVGNETKQQLFQGLVCK